MNKRKLNIRFEGDSWGAYPRKFLLFGRDANIVDHLRDFGHKVKSTASNGDEAGAMLVGKQKLDLLEDLEDHQYDCLLFSGGGNDIVGEHDMDFYIRNPADGEDPVNIRRFNNKLKSLKSAYIELIERVNDVRPGLPIFTHTYDKVIPKDKGFKLFGITLAGPWVYPFLVKKGIVLKSDQQFVINSMLSRYRTMLMEVSELYPQFTVVDTFGSVSPNQWRDEIHPNSDGFYCVAKIIEEKILEVLGDK